MEKKHIKVLLIEDNPGDVRLIWEILSEVRDSPFYLNVADTLLKGLQEIEKSKPDVILLDLTLPDSNGIYTLNRVRDKVKDIPIVVITGYDDEIIAIQSLKEGAQDYLVKGRTDADLLKRALLYAMERNRLLLEIDKKDKIRKDFITMVLHEIIIPTSIIKTAMWMCDKKEIIAKEDAKKIMDIVLGNTSKIFNFLDDLINVAELESGTFLIAKKQTDLNDLLKKTIKDIYPFAQEKSIQIINETEEQKIEAEIDPVRISQVITALLLNAIKYSEEKKEIKAGIKNEKNNFVLYIKDEGTGISRKDVDEVFNKFFSSSEENERSPKIGLGLLIAKKIVSAHNGKISVESDGIKKGSIFKIFLPK
ncbi:MAG: response regulator [Candidatus Goldbacteria bacterium]|nr:response regulator [Candidatus Goldiibacteriota bacterium]